MSVLKGFWEHFKGHQTIDMKQLSYPGEVPTFQELAEKDHEDKRALIYLVRSYDVDRKTPFSKDDLPNLSDFKTVAKTYEELKKKGIIIEDGKQETISLGYTQEELKVFLKENGLPVRGTKSQQIERLLNIKYLIIIPKSSPAISTI